jgi:hypothetical protein
MTDRQPGTPDDDLNAELEGDEEPATNDELLTDEEYANRLAAGDEAAEDEDGAADDTFATDDAAIGIEADEEVVETAPLAAAAATARRPRLGGPVTAPSAAPATTPSERAVHIDDRASQIFVIAVTATFLGVLLYGMLAGAGGFFTPVRSPSPTASQEPSSSASASPSGSAASASPAGTGAGASGSPAISGSAAPSASGAASPSASATP